MTVVLRPGRPDEADALSGIAFRAKAHWGYDEAFMEAARPELTFTAAQVAARRVTVAELDGSRAGFSIVDVSAGELSDLWVEPDRIGMGVGRTLWEDAVAALRTSGAHAVRVVADPHAESFYLAMGTRRMGEVPSDAIPGRTLPLLTFDLPAEAELRDG